MKLISSDAGAVTQYLESDEVRPVGGFYVTEVVRLIGERYGFSALPTAQDAAQTGAKFIDGRLIYGAKKINIRELSVYNDGVTVIASDTANAEFVLSDLFSWGQHAIGLRQPITTHLKQFDSVLVVDFKSEIEKLFQVFDPVRQLYSDMIARLYDFEGSVSPTRLAFARDHTKPLEPPHFRTNQMQWTIERRVGVPFDMNRFFSAAPLKTDMHINLLEALEDLAK